MLGQVKRSEMLQIEEQSLANIPTGIGKATAELLAQHGARIVACDLDAGKLDGLSNDLATITPRPQLLTFVGNLMDEGIPERLVKEALCKFGKVDSLINTAGKLVVLQQMLYLWLDVVTETMA